MNNDPVLLTELKQSKLYESCYIGFRIMARERMAKLIKYDHFEDIISHLITHFMSSQILHHQHVSLDLGGLKK